MEITRETANVQKKREKRVILQEKNINIFIFGAPAAKKYNIM